MLMNFNNTSHLFGQDPSSYNGHPSAHMNAGPYSKPYALVRQGSDRDDSVFSSGLDFAPSLAGPEISQNLQEQLQSQLELQQRLQEQYQLLQLSQGFYPQQQAQPSQDYVRNGMFKVNTNQNQLNTTQQFQAYPFTPISQIPEVNYFSGDMAKPFFEEQFYVYEAEDQQRLPSFDQAANSTTPISVHSVPAFHGEPVQYTDQVDTNYDLLTNMMPIATDVETVARSTQRLKKKPKALSPSRVSNDKYTSQPGPIPASTPEIVIDSATGEQRLLFTYSKKKVVSKFSLKCRTFDFNEPLNFDEEFLKENSIYPGAMCPPEEYQGKRGNYERECNIIGWNLASLNPEIRGCRGLIQRAVDSWRNTREDNKIRSRRVRKEHRMQNRKGLSE